MVIFGWIRMKVLNILVQNKSFMLWKLSFETKIGLNFL